MAAGDTTVGFTPTQSATTAKAVVGMETRLSALTADLKNAQPAVAASSSFFNELHNLFLMIGHNWKAEYIKVVAELTTAILMELLATGLTFLGGIKFKVRIVEEINPTPLNPTPSNPPSNDNRQTTTDSVSSKASGGSPALSFAKAQATNDNFFLISAPVRVQKHKIQNVAQALRVIGWSAPLTKLKISQKQRTKGSHDTGLEEGINYRFEALVIPQIESHKVKPSLRAIKRAFKCGQTTAENYQRGLIERGIIFWDEKSKRFKVKSYPIAA